MNNWVFATHNKHKLQEVAALFPFPLKSLWDLGINQEIPENSFTLRDNAFEKAQYVAQRCNCPCFADDTGLEVEALGGAPGVFSARYGALPSHFEAQMKSQGRLALKAINPLVLDTPPSFADNINRLLENLKGVETAERKASFVTVICLMYEKKPFFFEGRVEGEILLDLQGTDGFGYDPIFKPAGFSSSFAKLSLDEKNRISHRAQAVASLIRFVKNL